jgi:hypothetical protein
MLSAVGFLLSLLVTHRLHNEPFRLELSEDLPLRVVANRLDVDKAANIKFLRSEHRHIDGDGALLALLQSPLLGV